MLATSRTWPFTLWISAALSPLLLAVPLKIGVLPAKRDRSHSPLASQFADFPLEPGSSSRLTRCPTRSDPAAEVQAVVPGVVAVDGQVVGEEVRAAELAAVERAVEEREVRAEGPAERAVEEKEVRAEGLAERAVEEKEVRAEG